MSIDDVVRKWSHTGLLVHVKPVDVEFVALRLESAALTALKEGVGSRAVEHEIEAIRDEGLFGSSPQV